MSEKNLDTKGRFRSVYHTFRTSPEEAEKIRFFIKISGLTKQDYLIKKALNEDIILNCKSPHTVWALKSELKLIYESLTDNNRGDEYLEDVIIELKQILELCDKISFIDEK